MTSGRGLRLISLYGALALLFFGSWVVLSPKPVSGLEALNIGVAPGAVDEADAAMRRGDSEEAARVLEPARTGVTAQLLRGRAEIGAGRLADAEKTLAGVTRGDVHSARYKRALALWWSGRTDAAVVELDRLVDHPGGNLLGEATALRVHLSGSIKLPGEVRAEKKKSAVAVAKARVRAGQFSAAVSTLKLNAHRDGLAALYLGKAYLGMLDLGKAHAAFRDCADDHRSEEGQKCRYKMAVTSVMQGEDDRARTEVAKAQGGPLAAEAAALQRFLE